MISVGGFHRRLGGDRIIAPHTHLDFPVITFGQGNEISIGIFTLGDFGLHLLTGLRRQFHGFFRFQQGVLKQVIQTGIGPLEDEGGQGGDGTGGRCCHRVHHVIDTRGNIVERVGDRCHGIKLAAAVTQS